MWYTLWSPPEKNKEEQGKNTHEEGEDSDGDPVERITLYRGLGLPEKAI